MKKLYILSLISFYLLSCKSPTSPTTSNPNTSIVPLSIGNLWVMQTSYYDTLGNISSTFQDTIKIIGDTLVQGVTYFVMLDSYALIFCINRDDGYYGLWGDNKEYLLLKYPAFYGDNYSNPSVNMSVVSTDTLVTVPKGNFHCYHYSLINTSGINYPVNDYYSPGIGFIQMEVNYNHKPNIFVRRKLVDYLLK